MNHSYEDIISRIAGPPLWWDEHAVPRYCEFSPNVTANIYAIECVLLLIACQSCETEFHVCMSQSAWQTHESGRALASYIADDEIHYGDPPNACPDSCAGSTMNSVPLRVEQYWIREHEWVRKPEHERIIHPDWYD